MLTLVSLPAYLLGGRVVKNAPGMCAQACPRMAMGVCLSVMGVLHCCVSLGHPVQGPDCGLGIALQAASYWLISVALCGHVVVLNSASYLLVDVTW